jgi:hypothetical protein
MRMYPQETSFAFRKRVEDYQLERTSVGLEEIPSGEQVIGILNRLDMFRYASLVKDSSDIPLYTLVCDMYLPVYPPQPLILPFYI